MKKELLCIQCPLGCHLTADIGEDGKITVTGNTCKNGEAYAISECTNPRRTLTTILKAEDGPMPVSVRSDVPVPKDRIFECLRLLRDVSAPKGTRAGDVIVPNILNTGSNIIATRDDWNGCSTESV